MRRALVLVCLALAAACGTAFAWGGHRPVTEFRLADASAACRLEGARLVCANLRAPSALELPSRGGPRAVDAHVWWDASTPILSRWTHGPLSCRAAGRAILCRNASGATIAVGPLELSVAL